MKTLLKKILDRLKQRPENLVTNQSPENSNKNMAKYESIKPKSILKPHSQFENIRFYDNEDTEPLGKIESPENSINTMCHKDKENHNNTNVV